MAKVFFSYSHHDEALRDRLETQLAMLKRQGVIETWHDRRIGAGEEIDGAIDEHVRTDDIILLLASPEFIASDYCYDVEMRQALERHDAGEAIVIPVILRHCDWHHSPFGKLRATPTDGKPIISWTDIDQAMLVVAKELREAVGRLSAKAREQSPSAAVGTPATEAPRQVNVPSGPRSSNLSITKRFTDRDKDAFRIEAFEFIARYFENSLAELKDRNPGLEGSFRRVDANRFFATAYRDGSAVARATVFMGGGMGNGIGYVMGEKTESNTYNEQLNVGFDDQSLFLRAIGMSMIMRGGQETKLNLEGAAEAYWSTFIEPLQRN